MNRFRTSAETFAAGGEPLVFVALSVGLAVAVTIGEAAPSVCHGTVDRCLEIGQTPELNLELTPIRSSHLLDALKAGLELVASARSECIFPGQINASSRRFSKSHTDFL
jgi:hypothetical protein